MGSVRRSNPSFFAWHVQAALALRVYGCLLLIGAAYAAVRAAPLWTYAVDTRFRLDRSWLFRLDVADVIPLAMAAVGLTVFGMAALGAAKGVGCRRLWATQVGSAITRIPLIVFFLAAIYFLLPMLTAGAGLWYGLSMLLRSTQSVALVYAVIALWADFALHRLEREMRLLSVAAIG